MVRLPVRNLIEENENTYGQEVIKAYGADVLSEIGTQILNLTKDEFDEMKELEAEIRDLPEQAAAVKLNPKGEAVKDCKSP